MPGSTTPDARGSVNRAGASYWDAAGPRQLPAPTFPRAARESLTPLEPLAGKSLVEVGCARSVWLPQLARTFGMDVTGIDNSELGCRQTEALLEAAGVSGRVVCADARRRAIER